MDALELQIAGLYAVCLTASMPIRHRDMPDHTGHLPLRVPARLSWKKTRHARLPKVHWKSDPVPVTWPRFMVTYRYLDFSILPNSRDSQMKSWIHCFRMCSRIYVWAGHFFRASKLYLILCFIDTISRELRYNLLIEYSYAYYYFYYPLLWEKVYNLCILLPNLNDSYLIL